MNFITNFLFNLKNYLIEVLPVLLIGFLLSGIFYELVPQDLVRRYLVKKNFLTLFSVIIVGMILPICCIGSLPMAVGFKQKGVKLGNILAFLVATPATSVSSILVTLKFFGPIFTIYLCVSVVVLGFIIGIVGNLIDKEKDESLNDTQGYISEFLAQYIPKKNFKQKIISALRYAFFYLPKEIGFEVLLGLTLAAFISSLDVIKIFVENFLVGIFGYLFSVVFGVLMYICATASVPLVYALHIQGLDLGPSLVLLILGPLTSYATLLVINKTFGLRILLVYLFVIISFSLFSGAVYHILI